MTVHHMPPAPEFLPGLADYWQAVTDVPCPCCGTGIVRWAEGYVPDWRICDGCGQNFLTGGSASEPTLVEKDA